MYKIKQLTQPLTVEEVYRNRREYYCIFEDACFQMYPENVERFISDAKFFVKVYASVLYRRWFVDQKNCSQANILALIVFEGMLNDGTKMPIVSLFTGWPLHWVISNLIERLGIVLRDFYILKGNMRQYTVPKWAQYAIYASILVAIGAMILEWYVVRRKLTIKRSPAGKQFSSSRSKALMLVDSMSSAKRDFLRYH
uniref:Anoctamin n=1 Tax=Syphacia muris TaxID=451379 RepID=A0A0N5AWK1_9BILA